MLSFLPLTVTRVNYSRLWNRTSVTLPRGPKPHLCSHEKGLPCGNGPKTSRACKARLSEDSGFSPRRNVALVAETGITRKSYKPGVKRWTDLIPSCPLWMWRQNYQRSRPSAEVAGAESHKDPCASKIYLWAKNISKRRLWGSQCAWNLFSPVHSLILWISVQTSPPSRNPPNQPCPHPPPHPYPQMQRLGQGPRQILCDFLCHIWQQL